VPAPTGDLFSRFIRECVRPALKARGYTPAGQTYKKAQGHATAHLTFMRYTGAHSGHVDVRMSLTLDRHAAEMGGVVLMEDLSRHRYGSVAAAPWRWPCERLDWPSLGERLVGDVQSGAAWMESFFDLPALAAHLEGERTFGPDADVEVSRITQAMTGAGITNLYESPGYGSASGRIRPNKVAALSYCYELMEMWERSLDAWRDYMRALDDPKAVERQTYLEGKCRAG
jgi:hypothetical protein